MSRNQVGAPYPLTCADWTTVREEIVDDVVVQASAGRLWEVMMDWNSYDDWSSAVSGLRGSKVPSETFHVTYREFPYLGIPAQVLAFEPERKFRWMHAPFYFNGFLTLEHVTILRPLSDDKTKLHSVLYVRGILTPYLWPFFGTSADAALMQMNQDVKSRAESNSK